MSVSAFFDTNVLVYLYSIDEPEKRLKAFQCVEAAENRWISTQVLSELCNILRKKFTMEFTTIAAVIDEVLASFQVITVQPRTIRRALNVAQTYHYSYYDSLIIGAALEQSCDLLYSEDMQHEQTIKKRLQIINPFKLVMQGQGRT